MDVADWFFSSKRRVGLLMQSTSGTYLFKRKTFGHIGAEGFFSHNTKTFEQYRGRELHLQRTNIVLN